MSKYMQWHTLLNAKRMGGRAAKAEAGRSPFLSDHDKIIFSGAFRRLARKTQVHPLASHDMVHNRMTHSLEVACIGRTLAIRVGERLHAEGKLPANIMPTDLGDIVQTTCLAHDIGNPPFGHTGEKAIQDWFKNEGAAYIKDLSFNQQRDFQHFDGNAQGLRLLTQSESLQGDNAMHLTYATLASFMKYPWCASYYENAEVDNKFGFFNAELQLIEEVTQATGLLIKSHSNNLLGYARHPLSFLMEAADDFCYGLIDLEDGLYMGIIQWQDIFDVISPLFTELDAQSLEDKLNTISENQRPQWVRGRVMDAYISAAVDAFMDNEQAILAGSIDVDLISLCRLEVRESVENAKNLAKQKIFAHPKKVEVEIGAYDVIATILQQLIPPLQILAQSSVLPYECTEAQISVINGLLKDIPQLLIKDEYHLYMSVLDFVSGMTDNYAIILHQQLTNDI